MVQSNVLTRSHFSGPSPGSKSYFLIKVSFLYNDFFSYLSLHVSNLILWHLSHLPFNIFWCQLLFSSLWQLGSLKIFCDTCQVVILCNLNFTVSKMWNCFLATSVPQKKLKAVSLLLITAFFKYEELFFENLKINCLFFFFWWLLV